MKERKVGSEGDVTSVKRQRECVGARRGEKGEKTGERYFGVASCPPENGNHGRSRGALTGQRLLYFPDFPISRETIVAGYERAGSSRGHAGGTMRNRPSGKISRETRDADE